jgi:hypothetical protein
MAGQEQREEMLIYPRSSHTLTTFYPISLRFYTNTYYIRDPIPYSTPL